MQAIRADERAVIVGEFVSLPGIGGSGSGHWQTLWEAQNPSIRRFRPKDWNHPALDDWAAALTTAVLAARTPPVLVAHSLACLLVAHVADRIADRARGAFLVAVPDPLGPSFPREAASFGDAPMRPLPFPALVVASSNDPYGSPDHARRTARAWRAGFVEVGALGHINVASGLGTWPQGAMLLQAFCAGLGR